MRDKTLRLDLSQMRLTFEEVPAKWFPLGGRGLTSTIIADEVTPLCHPLGEQNKIVFAPGLLSGTPVASAGRLSVGSKSPLTGTIKEGNVCGTSASILARLGIKALIIEGQPVDKSSWYALHIDESGASIDVETETVGMGNFDVVRTLANRFGDETGVITIGAAGEMRMCGASMFLKSPDTTMQSFSRGGLGAVMGSKNLKYISIAPANRRVNLADEAGFHWAMENFARALINNPISQSLAQDSEFHPTGNVRPEHAMAESLTGTSLNTPQAPLRHSNAACLENCPQLQQKINVHKVEPEADYKTIWALGAYCGMDNLDQVAEAEQLLDDIGLDATEIAAALGVAMEADLLEYGDGVEVCRILREEIAAGTPLGRIIGNGAASVGQAYGIIRVPVIKNQAIPPYDPRTNKGMGVTYATSPHGADHFLGYMIASKIYGTEKQLDRLSNKGQVDFSRNLQLTTATIDSTGLSLLLAFPALKDPSCTAPLIALINARFGLTLTKSDLLTLGCRIMKIEHRFNIEAGLTNKDDRLPEFFKEKLNASSPHVWDMSDEELDCFWDF